MPDPAAASVQNAPTAQGRKRQGKPRGPRVRPPVVGAGYTVLDLAARWRIGGDRIRAMIQRGELAALNVSPSKAGKPRFVVTAEEVERWEARHRVAEPRRLRAPRRKRPPAMIDFYPD